MYASAGISLAGKYQHKMNLTDTLFNLHSADTINYTIPQLHAKPGEFSNMTKINDLIN